MPGPRKYPAKHWHMRAEEAYSLAERAPEIREAWLRVAESYEARGRAAEAKGASCRRDKGTGRKRQPGSRRALSGIE